MFSTNVKLPDCPTKPVNLAKTFDPNGLGTFPLQNGSADGREDHTVSPTNA